MIVVHYLVFLLFRGLESVLAFLPLWTCSVIGGWLGNLAYFVWPGARRRTVRNLLIAFGGEIGIGECRRIGRRHFAALGKNVLCGIKLSLMRPGSVEKRVRYENAQAALELAEEHSGAIGAILHMGPWPLLTRIPLFGPDVSRAHLYQPLGNPFLDRHLLRSRSGHGLVFFDQRQGYYGPMNHLREAGSLSLFIDQHAGSSGVWCPFFGRLASTTNLPALLALRTGAPIIPIGIYPDGVARWRVVYGDPIRTTDDGGCEISSAKLTATLNQAAERIVRRVPEEWFWIHERWKTPRPEFLLSAYRRGVEYQPGFRKEHLKPFRILIRSSNWLGDACMSVPTVRAIKQGRPDAEITILCNENLAELWRAVRHVDHVVARPRRASVWKAARLIRRAGPFDAGILFPNSIRSALEMKLAGVAPVVGYADALRARIVDQAVPERKTPGPPEHHAWRYLRIAQAIGADKSDPDLYASREHRPRFEGTWRIGLCPGAAYGGAKRWPAERYAKAVETLHQRLEGQAEWSVYGAPNEADLAASLTASCPVSLHNLVGKTSISELMERLQGLHVLITNDTGTMHLAGLLGVPTVSIFGSTEPALTSPLGKNHRILRRHVECSPCFLRECPLDFRCMTRIEVHDVVEATLAVLKNGAEALGTPS
jgi:lipopolysaccharide heptosyltransferase II